MNQASSGLLFYAKGRPMSTTLNNIMNISLYGATLAGTFLAENWYLVIMVTFGAIHAYAAWRKHKREEREADYKVKDRELLIARADERLRQEQEFRELEKEKEAERIKIAEFEKKRNRDASNKRADLYCEEPNKRRTSLMTIEGGRNE